MHVGNALRAERRGRGRTRYAPRLTPSWRPRGGEGEEEGEGGAWFRAEAGAARGGSALVRRSDGTRFRPAVAAVAVQGFGRGVNGVVGADAGRRVRRGG